MKKAVSILAVALCGVSAWDYTKEGQKLWGNEFPMCAGKEQDDRTYVNMQSPIEIPKGKGKSAENQYKKGKYLPDLTVDLANSVGDVTIRNNGHFLTIDGFSSANKLSKGGLVLNDYYLDHIDVHWPAEHKVEGSKYKGEFQIFFKKPETATSIGTDTVAIVTFFKKGKSAKAQSVQSIIAALPELTADSSSKTLSGFDVSEFFLKKTLKKYHTYQGLTSYPPCDTTVTWVISDDKTLSVKNKEYSLFEEIWKENNRRDQKIAARSVFNSYRKPAEEGGNSIEDLLSGGKPSKPDPMGDLMSQLGR